MNKWVDRSGRSGLAPLATPMMSLMLFATAGTLAANIISKEIAAKTIMVTKTTHSPITGRRDVFGANGVCAWKVFVERLTAFCSKGVFVEAIRVPMLARQTHPAGCAV